MKFHFLSLFPEMFEGPLTESILKRAAGKGLLSFHFHNIRDFALDRHSTVDDAPYGGGAGMVMKVEPIARCLDYVLSLSPDAKIILTTPAGEQFSQSIAQRFVQDLSSLILICGRYEGIDERVRELYPVIELSIGDYVLTGGELPAMIIADAVSRLIPGVLGSEESYMNDSFSQSLLEYPQYTRPPVFREKRVPEVLLSGNHAEIDKWRMKMALERTVSRRPDIMKKAAAQSHLKESGEFSG